MLVFNELLINLYAQIIYNKLFEQKVSKTIILLYNFALFIYGFPNNIYIINQIYKTCCELPNKTRKSYSFY